MEVTNGAPYQSALFNTDGRGLPVIRIRDVGKPCASTFYDGDYEERHVVEHGDLLVGMDGDFRAARWAGPRSLLNQRVCRLRLRNQADYSAGLLTHVLQPYLDEIHKVTSVVTVKHLSSKTVEDLPVPLPPRTEQERIVAVIEEHLSSLGAAVAAIASARRRLEAFERAAVSSLFNRDDWSWTTLGEIADLKGGVTKDATRQADPSFVEVPYLRVANVQRGFLDLSEVTSIRVPPAKAEQLVLQPGDILFNEGGDRDKLGRGPSGRARSTGASIRTTSSGPG